MVQSEDITSNTSDTPSEALTDEFWGEVERHNNLLTCEPADAL